MRLFLQPAEKRICGGPMRMGLDVPEGRKGPGGGMRYENDCKSYRGIEGEERSSHVAVSGVPCAAEAHAAVSPYTGPRAENHGRGTDENVSAGAGRKPPHAELLLQPQRGGKKRSGLDLDFSDGIRNVSLSGSGEIPAEGENADRACPGALQKPFRCFSGTKPAVLRQKNPGDRHLCDLYGGEIHIFLPGQRAGHRGRGVF